MNNDWSLSLTTLATVPDLTCLPVEPPAPLSKGALMLAEASLDLP